MVDKKFFGLIVVVLVLTGLVVTLINSPVKISSTVEDLEVTVYNSNLGVVKEYRTNFLASGLNDVLYSGVASSIDPTSVRLKSLQGGLEVLEQNFQYDLVSKDRILSKYIDKKITAYTIYGDEKELIEGTLLSYSGSQVILEDESGKIHILSVSDLLLPELPEGLITKPTLEWKIDNKLAGNHTLELSYMTSGLTWDADYVAVVDDSDSVLDLNGWVTITNNAGTTFEDASLKLVAGDVNVERTNVVYAEDTLYSPKASGSSQFSEEAFFEYHLYDLERKTTLKDNEQKQISLMSAGDVGVRKEYVYDDISSWWWYGRDWSEAGEKKVDVNLNFENSLENNLGLPLPKGTVRVFKEDSEGKLQFIGENEIDHTPKDEEITLFLGQAFDVVGERKQADYNLLDNWYEYTWEVSLRNHKDEDIVVSVLERTSGDWTIVEENFDHVKDSNSLITWDVPVKKDGETKLTYTIRYKRA